MRKTEKLKASRSRSECIIIFPTWKDAGQRFRNVVAECLTDDALTSLVL